MKNKVVRMGILLLLSALLVIPDRLTKIWAVERLMGKEDIILWEGVFQLHYLENRGMAFGMLQNQQLFLLLVTLVILGFTGYIAWKTPAEKRYLPVFFCLCLIVSGAVGNMIDRISQKYVVDFLYFSLIDFPVFNVADSYVTVSCVLLFLFCTFVYKEEELDRIYGRKKKKKAAETEEGTVSTPETPSAGRPESVPEENGK